MPRPIKCRRVEMAPPAALFKPAGKRCSEIESVSMTLDELEALRLADLRLLEQGEAAELMNVSRQTFGNIVRSARAKTARCLSEGLALRIEGGTVAMRCGKGLRCGRGKDGPRCPRCKLKGENE